MSIITMIIVGFIVGLLARALKPGNDRMGIIMTTIVGIVGSLLAGWVGQAMGWYRPGQPAGWIASILGAIVLLVIVAMVRRPRYYR
ncbi:GlsB/YeaQ/YmgE family stress response membrane protein [Ramlibacter ginsenosidimutans]|uniref:GlsB/YeaQ/YmgE family stress response membrane protein n=1 Tax=Ramlibacter ginsenosidimutans TaxID=502333 RepID=A0A934WK88_9BURK|nr:GlsB/YeaQ/YmgE family stress response membrane protein [Ramlibacter ginsenosidimutans]MBK6005479.1 GlsB/YeaQ/YmgE family stress response membrane protein [Ramlibacter ginsenosidimutans]